MMSDNQPIEEGRKILFIIGFPRSGTKLLRDILNNHDEVYLAGELLFLPHMLENWGAYGDLSNIANFRRMHEQIMREHYFAVRAIQGIEMIGGDEWYEACETFDPLGVLLPLIRRETKAPQGSNIWLGDKSPNYTTHVLAIKRAIPEAKFIHIIRDVRDASLSARKIWHKNIFRFSQRWADGMRLLWKDVEQMPKSDFLEVRYEDLINNPAETLKQITNFLNLDYKEDMMDLQKPAENFGDARSAFGILPGNTGKYRKQLSLREQRKIESLSGSVLRHYKYDCQAAANDRHLSKFHLAWYMVSDIFNRLIFDLRLGHSLGFITRSMASRSRTRL